MYRHFVAPLLAFMLTLALAQIVKADDAISATVSPASVTANP